MKRVTERVKMFDTREEMERRAEEKRKLFQRDGRIEADYAEHLND